MLLCGMVGASTAAVVDGSDAHDWPACIQVWVKGCMLNLERSEESLAHITCVAINTGRHALLPSSPAGGDEDATPCLLPATASWAAPQLQQCCAACLGCCLAGRSRCHRVQPAAGKELRQGLPPAVVSRAAAALLAQAARPLPEQQTWRVATPWASRCRAVRALQEGCRRGVSGWASETANRVHYSSMRQEQRLRALAERKKQTLGFLAQTRLLYALACCWPCWSTTLSGSGAGCDARR